MFNPSINTILSCDSHMIYFWSATPFLSIHVHVKWVFKYMVLFFSQEHFSYKYMSCTCTVHVLYMYMTCTCTVHVTHHMYQLTD